MQLYYHERYHDNNSTQTSIVLCCYTEKDNERNVDTFQCNKHAMSKFFRHIVKQFASEWEKPRGILENGGIITGLFSAIKVDGIWRGVLVYWWHLVKD